MTLTKEGGELALEAGALVMADLGCCCIDEFDKMGQQQQALLEAMEQPALAAAVRELLTLRLRAAGEAA